MSDTRLDIERDKYLEWKQQQKEAMRSACESCENHNTDCLILFWKMKRKTKAIGNLRNVLEIQEVGNERDKRQRLNHSRDRILYHSTDCLGADCEVRT